MAKNRRLHLPPATSSSAPVVNEASSDSSQRMALRDLVDGAAALHRHQRLDALDAIGLAAAGVNVGVDEAGPDRVDANAFFGNLLRQADRERVDRALRGGVIHVLARRSHARGTGGDIDDRAAAAAVPR